LEKNNSEFGKELLDNMSTSILPIVSDSGSKMEMIGSSILLSTGQKSYIVTAAHVLGDSGHTKLHLLTEEKSIRIRCSLIHFDNQLDIAFSELNDELITFLKKTGKNCFPIDIEEPNDFDKKCLCAFGYPSSKCHYDSVRKKFEICLMEYFGEEVTQNIKFDKSDSLFDKHLLINFDKRRTKKPEKECKGYRPAPNPYGLSGGGLFKVYIYKDHQLFLLKGILIEWHKKDIKVIKALKTDALKEVISNFQFTG